MAFVLDDVINEIEETRSLDPLKKLKKEHLIDVAAHYAIPQLSVQQNPIFLI